VSANESATIGDVRTVISGMAAYQSANAGWYDQILSCLAVAGPTCIPNYPANAPTFLDSNIAFILPKSGYNRSFEPGPAPVPTSPLASGTQSSSYAYLASPVNQGQTGVRGFGGDSSGVLCFTPDGQTPPTTGNGALNFAGGCNVLQ
jgi:hypothetical protein